MQLLNNRYAIVKMDHYEFGKIYLCQDTKSNELVTIQESIGDYDAKISEQIEYDYYLVMGMERPIKPQGFFVIQNRYFFVMQHIENEKQRLAAAQKIYEMLHKVVHKESIARKSTLPTTLPHTEIPRKKYIPSRERWRELKEKRAKKKKSTTTRIILLFVVIFVGTNLWKYIKTQYVINHCNNAKLYMQKHQYDLALKELASALKYNERKATVYYQRGLVSKAMLGREKLALQSFSQAITLDRKNAQAYYQRALLYMSQKNNRAALHDLSKTIQFDRQNSQAYYRRGLVYSQLKGKSMNALNDFSTAIRLAPNKAIFYYQRGLLYSKIRAEEDKALRDFATAIKLGLRNYYIYSERAKIYQRKQVYKEALADLSTALHMDGTQADGYYQRGIIYKRQNKYTAAIADFSNAVNVDGKFSKGYTERGNAYYRQKKYDLAIEDWVTAAKVDGLYIRLSAFVGDDVEIEYITKLLEIKVYSRAYLDRGNIHCWQKRYNLAVNDWIKAAEIDGRYSYYTFLLGDDLTIKYWTKFIELQPRSAHAYLERGKKYYEQNKVLFAIKDWSRVLDIDRYRCHVPDVEKCDSVYYGSMLEFLTKALKKFPYMEKAYRARGYIYRKQQKYELALRDFNNIPIIRREMSKNSRYILKYTEKMREFRENVFRGIKKKDPVKRLSIEEDTYNKAMFRENNNDFKLKFLAKFIECYPKFVQAYVDRGKIYKEQKKYAWAIKDWEKAIKLGGAVRELQRWIDDIANK